MYFEGHPKNYKKVFQSFGGQDNGDISLKAEISWKNKKT